MAASKYVNLDRLTQYDELIKNYIDTADAKAFKSAKFDSTTRILSLYKAETTDGTADFTVEIPETDVSNLLEKIFSGVVGNVVTIGADGIVVDGGTALADLATKAEVEAVDAKIGTISDLETTNKTDLVVAINEVRNAVSAGGTEAAVTMDTNTTTEGALKSYTFKQGTNTIGVVDIPKDLVVTEGSVVVNPDGQDEGTYIKLVIANQEEPLYVNVGSLVDLYTAEEAAGQVQLYIDNTTRVISATLAKNAVDTDNIWNSAITTAKIADANVTLAKLASDVTAAFDSAGSAQAAETNAKAAVTTLENGQVKTNTDAIAALETKVGDGFESITEDEINALFG